MLVELRSPVNRADGSEVTEVFIRVPPRSTWDANPIGIDQSSWNLAHILDLPINTVRQISMADRQRIDDAWSAVVAQHNADRFQFRSENLTAFSDRLRLRDHLRLGSYLAPQYAPQFEG